MAEHQNAQKTASRLPNKDLWLAELDALEQEYLAFQQRGGGAQCTAYATTRMCRRSPQPPQADDLDLCRQS